MSQAIRTLPARRLAATITFELFDGYTCQTYSGCYAEFADCSLAEVFLTPVYGGACKVGTPLDTMAKDLSVLFSIARRFGAPTDVILAALSQEANGTMLGPLGEFLRLHRLEPPILRFDPDDDTSSPADAVPPAAPRSGEGGEAVTTRCLADPSGLAASFAGAPPVYVRDPRGTLIPLDFTVPDDAMNFGAQP